MRRDYHTDAIRLQEAVDGVYDAHGVAPERRIPIVGHPRFGDLMALSSAKIVADTHATHDGIWTPGSCDGELFALDWAIWDIEHPAPEPTLRQVVRSLLRRLSLARNGVAAKREVEE